MCKLRYKLEDKLGVSQGVKGYRSEYRSRCKLGSKSG